MNHSKINDQKKKKNVADLIGIWKTVNTDPKSKFWPAGDGQWEKRFTCYKPPSLTW